MDKPLQSGVDKHLKIGVVFPSLIGTYPDGARQLRG